MKVHALNLCLILLSISFWGCEKDNMSITPSNTISSQNHVITDFNELLISDPFQVQIIFSNTEESLRIEANENLHPLIQVKQNNGTLQINLEKNTNIQGSATLNVYLSTKAIEILKAQGAAHIQLQNPWNQAQMEVYLEGACTMVGTVNGNQLDAELLGASHLNLEGSTTYLEIKAEGASTLNGFTLETDELLADLNGGCEVSLTVNDQLSVKANGASKVFYKGTGVIEEQNLSGGSKIVKME